ncbi:MAG: hypothetical protein P0Y51_28965 [Candidatus Pseudomonas colombiensis]|nr:MAG: hypothetical protein P0Y51_28965 [Pseudomonas sp.]
MRINASVLKEVLRELEEIIPVVDKIGSGFSTQESTALALLLFFRETHALDKLSSIRKILTNHLSKILSSEEFDEWLEADVRLWEPPYNKSSEEIVALLYDLKG